MAIETTKKVDESFSTTTMRRDAKGVSESLTVSENVSGAPDEVYQLRNQDGTSVTIHGEEVVVSDRYEQDIRYYLVRDVGDMRISHRERLRMTPSGGASGGHVDDACIEQDRALIEGALKMYERAKTEPAGFRASSPFEEVKE